MESPAAIRILRMQQKRQANFLNEGLFGVRFHLVRN
jgi:hypothetical protein